MGHWDRPTGPVTKNQNCQTTDQYKGSLLLFSWDFRYIPSFQQQQIGWWTVGSVISHFTLFIVPRGVAITPATLCKAFKHKFPPTCSGMEFPARCRNFSTTFCLKAEHGILGVFWRLWVHWCQISALSKTGCNLSKRGLSRRKKGFLSDSVHTSHPWTSGSTWGKFYLSVWQYQKLKSKTGRMGLDAPSFLTMSQKPIFSSEGLSYCWSCCCNWSNWEADWVTDPSGATMGHWTPPGHYAFTYHIEQWPVKRYLQLVLPCHQF